MKKLVAFTFIISSLLLPQTPFSSGGGSVAWAKKHDQNKHWDGTLVGSNPGASSIQVQTKNGAAWVLVQHSTQIKSRQGLTLFQVPVGSRVKVEGQQLDDGRILASKVEVKELAAVAPPPPRPAPASNMLNLTNLRPNTQVPAHFNVQGVTVPNSRILVELRSQTSGQSYHFEGGSNQAGNFDIGASAQNEPYGGKMTLVVQAITPQGVEVGQRQVALIRQRQ